VGIGKIEITGQSGWDSCECCGSYTWEHYTIKKDGVVILDHLGDTHLDGGEWHSWEYAVRDILGALGYEVEIDVDEGC
jgi:hypothetical protein